MAEVASKMIKRERNSSTDSHLDSEVAHVNGINGSVDRKDLRIAGVSVCDDEELEIKPEISLERRPTDFLHCPECSEKFASHDELNSHALKHDALFKFFDVAMGLVMLKPVVVIDTMKIYECMKCSRVFRKKTEHELHKLVHLREALNKVPTTNDDPNLIEVGSKRIKLAKINGQKQRKRSNIDSQKETKRAKTKTGKTKPNVEKIDTPYDDRNYPKRLKCLYCALKFTASSMLKGHLITHRPFPYICFCGCGYRLSSILAEHLKLVHNVDLKIPQGLPNEQFDSLIDRWQVAAQKIDMIFKRNKNYKKVKDTIMCQICTQADLKTPKGLTTLQKGLKSKLHCKLSDYADTQKCERCKEQFVQEPSRARCYSCPKAFFGFKRLFKHQNKMHNQKDNHSLNNVLGEMSENLNNLLK